MYECAVYTATKKTRRTVPARCHCAAVFGNILTYEMGGDIGSQGVVIVPIVVRKSE
jgi:hypothetical protein